MKALARIQALATLFIILILPVLSSAQDQRRPGEFTGSISGRITIGSKPAAGITVALLSSGASFQQPPVSRTRTDEQGYYRFNGLQVGQFIVSPLAPSYVAPTDINQFRPGKAITLHEGEAVESFDIQLIRGGVITGRVTDADGRPVIAARVRIDDRDKRRPLNLPMTRMYETDDRGIYRLYGLPEGRYTVSLGENTNRPAVRIGGGPNYYTRTFHPDVIDENKATVIEVTPGSETTGVDIKIGRPTKSFTASGRVLDSRTGRPVTGATCGYGPLSPDGTLLQGYGMGYRTDSAGNFKLEGLMPGRYAAFAVVEGDTESYSEPAIFQVEGDNVRGLEIKLVSGSSISGVAVIEGTDDPAVLARLSQLQFFTSNRQESGLSPPRPSPVRIAPDGSFRAGGLQPGKIMLYLMSAQNHKGFALLRIEHNGVEQRGPIEVAAGEHITGVRAVIAYGTSVMRGQIKVEGGTLPEGVVFQVVLQRQGGIGQSYAMPVQADERGRFFLDGLVAGDYEIRVFPRRTDSAGGQPIPIPIQPVRQTVTVGHNTEADVTITVNLGEGR
jgi:protocatechuate 3,4-dioxygenase beta subunit